MVEMQRVTLEQVVLQVLRQERQKNQQDPLYKEEMSIPLIVAAIFKLTDGGLDPTEDVLRTTLRRMERDQAFVKVRPLGNRLVYTPSDEGMKKALEDQRHLRHTIGYTKLFA